jgi:hypothetical protein
MELQKEMDMNGDGRFPFLFAVEENRILCCALVYKPCLFPNQSFNRRSDPVVGQQTKGRNGSHVRRPNEQMGKLSRDHFTRGVL